MKIFYLLITVTLFLVCISNAFAQQKELPPPPREDKEARKEHVKAQQLFEQYRLSRPISEERADEIIGFFSKIDPDIVNEMAIVKSQNPESYQDRLRQMENEMRYLSRLQEEPQRFEQAIVLRKMEVQANKLARQFRQSKDDTEKSDIEKKLKENLIKLFEMKEQEKELEIERIMERVDQMRQEIKERKANKENIIKLRMNELLGKEHLSRW